MHESDPQVTAWLQTYTSVHGKPADPVELTRQTLTIPLGPCYGGAALPKAEAVAAFLREALSEVDPAVVHAESSSIARAYVASGVEPMASMGALLEKVAQLLGPAGA